MTVDRGKALTATHAGQTYSFCSEGCRASFLAGPEHSHRRTRPPTRTSDRADRRRFYGKALGAPRLEAAFEVGRVP